MRRKGLVLILAGALALGSSFVSLAGWEQVDNTWKYSENGVYLSNGWFWLDGNNDGVSECYYFDSNGIMLADTLVEGYTVNQDGAWTVDGVVQTRVLTQETTNDTSSNGYTGSTADLPGFSHWVIEGHVYKTVDGGMLEAPGAQGGTSIDPNFHPVM